METTMINANDVKKELYKSKVNAKFSHYTAGNIYYTVELPDGIYQFPISTIETISINSMDLKVRKGISEQTDIELRYIYENAEPLYAYDKNEEKYVDATCKILSTDLGTTPFYNEVKASELNRWIVKAIEKNEFVKVS